jgi:hypothetical protein
LGSLEESLMKDVAGGTNQDTVCVGCTVVSQCSNCCSRTICTVCCP